MKKFIFAAEILILVWFADSTHASMCWISKWFTGWFTQLGSVKQEIKDFKAGFESWFNEIKHSIDSKFSDINDHLKDIKESFTKSVHDIVTERISKWKRLNYWSTQRIEYQASNKMWKSWS